MPEISQAELNEFNRYRRIGETPGEVESKIRQLESDNKTQRTEINDLKTKMPKDGQVIVPKEDADLLPEYKTFGKPTEVKDKLSKGDQAQKDLGAVRARDAAVKFAKVAGLADDAVDTLIALPQLAGAKFEVRKGKVKDKAGKEVDGEVPYLTLAGDGQHAMQWEKAREEIPALKGLAPAAPTTNQSSVQTVPQGSQGTPSGSGSVYDKIREDGKARQAAAKTASQAPTARERLRLAPKP